MLSDPRRQTGSLRSRERCSRDSSPAVTRR
jgi:hypothetical protein